MDSPGLHCPLRRFDGAEAAVARLDREYRYAVKGATPRS
jgi:hypothetical protein